MASQAADPVQRFLENLKKPNSMRSKGNGGVPYESVISHLMVKEPVEEDGCLKLRPKFFSLPFVAQTRCLHNLMCHHTRISDPALHQFVSLVEEYPHQKSWIEHGIRQLKKCVNNSTCSNFKCDKLATETNHSNYLFTRESEEMKNELITKLGTKQNKDSHLIHIERKGGAKKVTEMCRTDKLNTYKVDPAAGIFQTIGEGSGFLTDKMAVIDVDSYNDSLKEGLCNQGLEGGNDRYKESSVENKKEDMGYPCNMQGQAETATHKDDNFKNNSDCILITSDSDDLADERDKERKVLQPSLMHKRNYAKSSSVEQNCEANLQGDNRETSRDYDIKKHKKDERKSKLESCKDEDEAAKCLPEINSLDTEKTEGLKGSQSSELELSSLKEILYTNNQDETFATQFWDCFMEVNPKQLPEACQFLMLNSLSEETLLALCDSLPSLHLSHQMETVFLQHTLSDKLSHLSSRASHMLLNILYSVLKHKPRTIMEILTTCIERSKSGESQCHVLVSLCKNSFPVECISFFIRQLSLKNIQVNHHLTSALQAVVNKACDLDDDTLKLLLSTLSKNNETLSASAPFGKLLLTVITKFKTKMTDEIKVMMTKIVDTHKSSLKKTLLKKLEAQL